MKRSKAEKAETHSKIVSVAARRFRERGLEGIGIAEVMKEIGNTTGGFYRHFESRDDLVIEALGEAFQDLDRLERETETLPGLLTKYLSEEHCSDPGSGCALTALAGDVRHAGTGVRAVFTERVKHNLGYYADRNTAGDAAARRARAILLFSAALGGLTVARAVNDKALSREILATLREQLLPLAGEASPRRPEGKSSAPARRIAPQKAKAAASR